MKLKKSDLYIIVPAWNESKAIGATISEIQHAGYKNLIVIDDGSDDNTFDVISQIKNIYALRHIINRGKGATVETGFAMALKLNAKAVVIIDADGQHNPADIDKMLEKYNEGYDVILGSRLFDPTGMPFKKQIQNKIGNLIVYLLYGLWVTDSQSGFRLFSNTALRKIEFRVVDRFAFDSEVIREIYRHNLRYAEVPIEVRYTKYSMSKVGHQNLYRGVKMLFKMIFSL